MELITYTATKDFEKCDHLGCFSPRWDPENPKRYVNICHDCGGWQLVTNRVLGDWKPPSWGPQLKRPLPT